MRHAVQEERKTDFYMYCRQKLPKTTKKNGWWLPYERVHQWVHQRIITADLSWIVSPLAVHIKLVLMLSLRQIHNGHKGVLTLTDDKGEHLGHRWVDTITSLGILNLINNMYALETSVLNFNKALPFTHRNLNGTIKSCLCIKPLICFMHKTTSGFMMDTNNNFCVLASYHWEIANKHKSENLKIHAHLLMRGILLAQLLKDPER